MTTILESVNLDKSFVRELIIAHGPIPAIDIIHKCFGDSMNYSISDYKLRIMIWQITHSLHILRNDSDIQCYNLSAIERIIGTTKSKNVITISNHIKLAFDNIIEYVTE
jgi:hypothetical protein